MENIKSYIRQLADSRKKLIFKLEEFLGTDTKLKLYHNKLKNWHIDVIAKNESILVEANENFKDSFEKVDYETTYNAKGEPYKKDFKSSYEQCKAAVKSNGNLSLNAAVIGVIGSLYDPRRFSTGYNVYDDLNFRVSELYSLDNEYFNKIEDCKDEYMSIYSLVRLIYDIDKTRESKNVELTEIEDDEELEIGEDDQLVYSRNKILFGPPGTGKSYNIKSKMNLINIKDKNIIRTTFHPEYSYYEFVGQYKPVVA